MGLFAPLRAVLPKVARLAPRQVPTHAPAFRAFTRPLSTLPPRPSILSSLPKRPFAAPSPASGNRSVATAVRPSDQVDWTKVATSVGIAAVAVIGLNLALNRETRDVLSLAESS